MAILSEKRQKCFGLRRKDVRMRAIICDDDGRFAKKLEQLIMQYAAADKSKQQNYFLKTQAFTSLVIWRRQSRANYIRRGEDCQNKLSKSLMAVCWYNTNEPLFSCKNSGSPKRQPFIIDCRIQKNGGISHEHHHRYRPRLLRNQGGTLFIPGWADKLRRARTLSFSR